MRKILFIVFFIIFYNKMFSQEYTPMLEIGKIWNMHHYDNFLPLNNYDFNISLDNVVSINGIEYFEASNGDLFREDIVDKKIYQLNNDIEELILDFDLEIGDDLISPLILIDETTFSKEITEIGIGTFYGIPNLKYYQIECGERIIESIGVEDTGLFDLSTSCAPLDFDEGDYLINMNYVPMMVENANWIILHSDGDLFPPFNDDIYYGYSIKGDTIINNIDYKKVYYRRFFAVNSFDEEETIQPPFTVGYEYLFGAMRDDVPNKKVFGIDFCTNTDSFCSICNEEYLMYDFSLEIGESTMDLCIYDGQFEVYTIGFNNIFGYNRKVFNLNDDYNSIEGIGSSFGLFEYAFGCFCNETKNLYDYCIGEDNYCFDEFLLSKNDYLMQNSIDLFYNSIAKQLVLTNNSDVLIIEIYSILGKKVINSEINNVLDVSKLQKGIYFYSLSKNNAVKKGKVLIY